MSIDALPLFIVGLPRSGTTLLRNLLDQHSQITLTRHESHFLPRLLAYVERVDDFAAPHAAQRIASIVETSTLHEDASRREGTPVTSQQLRDAIEGADDIESLTRSVLAPYLAFSPEIRYWGDKTPRYLDHIGDLHRHLPRARFVHIVRDPRDQVISEAQAWGKSLERSAQRWQDSILAAREAASRSGAAYLEVTYEALVSDPARILRRICEWLDLPPEDDLTSSVRDSDELGQSQGRTDVHQDAVGGQRQRVRPAVLHRVERLTAPLSVDMGYVGAAVPARIGPVRAKVLAATDALGILRYDLRTRGTKAGTIATWRRFREKA